MPMGEMSCVNKVLVVVLGLVQLSQGDIIELKKFHPEPSNYFELNFDHKVTANDGVSSPREALHSVSFTFIIIMSGRSHSCSYCSLY